ncbi:rhoGEF domain-containing protein gxcI-like isoform X3 [Sitophilus oryzae]|uniref:RhoGEF domain-containing protein gxcI-like isoform X3 n=1 Tax=Sitophilus oryzae TaxID=7048 RepID=A0A6J2Y306_SITOR|nr:rhoGEF domain-containing protein gxcI-like isoform X3 [Sitophilus oryzae]
MGEHLENRHVSDLTNFFENLQRTNHSVSTMPLTSESTDSISTMKTVKEMAKHFENSTSGNVLNFSNVQKLQNIQTIRGKSQYKASKSKELKAGDQVEVKSCKFNNKISEYVCDKNISATSSIRNLANNTERSKTITTSEDLQKKSKQFMSSSIKISEKINKEDGLFRSSEPIQKVSPKNTKGDELEEIRKNLLSYMDKINEMMQNDGYNIDSGNNEIEICVKDKPEIIDKQDIGVLEEACNFSIFENKNALIENYTEEEKQILGNDLLKATAVTSTGDIDNIDRTSSESGIFDEASNSSDNIYEEVFIDSNDHLYLNCNFYGLYPKYHINESTLYKNHVLSNYQLTDTKNKLKCIIEEMIQSEKEYILDLSIIIFEYQKLVKLDGISNYEDIFGNIEDIYKLQLEFSKQLELSNQPEDVLKTFCQHETLFNMYPTFFKQTLDGSHVLEKYSDLLQKIQKKTNNPQNLSFYLVKPLQRLVKYKMFLESIYKELEEEQRGIWDTFKALKIVEWTLYCGNREVAISSISNSPLKPEEYGAFKKEDTFSLVSPKKLKVAVYLFSKVVVFATKTKCTSRFQYWNSISISSLGIVLTHDKTLHLVDFENKSKKINYVLKAKSKKLKDAWSKEVENILWKEFEVQKASTMSISSDWTGSVDTIKSEEVISTHSENNSSENSSNTGSVKNLQNIEEMYEEIKNKKAGSSEDLENYDNGACCNSISNCEDLYKNSKQISNCKKTSGGISNETIENCNGKPIQATHLYENLNDIQKEVIEKYGKNGLSHKDEASNVVTFGYITKSIGNESGFFDEAANGSDSIYDDVYDDSDDITDDHSYTNCNCYGFYSKNLINKSVLYEESVLSNDQSADTKNKIKFIIEEMVQSEKKYILDLEIIIYEYQELFKLSGISDIEEIFGNIEDIYNKQLLFCKQLELAKEPEDILKCFSQHESLFNMYPIFLKQTLSASHVLEKYEEALQKVQKKTNDPLNLPSYLLKPLQRLVKYKLFLENIYKQVQREERVVYDSFEALKIVKWSLSLGDREVAISSIANSPIKPEEYGAFKKEDKFLLVSPKKLNVVVYLFSKFVVFATKTECSNRFQYWNSISIKSLSMVLTYDKTLHLMDYRNKSKKLNYILQARTESLKKFWAKEIQGILWKEFEAEREKRLMTL